MAQNGILETFVKIYRENPNLLKIGQKYGEFYTIDLITFTVLCVVRNISYFDSAKVNHCFVSMATLSTFVLLASRVVIRTHHIVYLVQVL
jgi:hypothetical protein